MKVDDLLEAFVHRAQLDPNGVPFTSHFPGDSATRPGFHLVLGFITHGNEWGTLPAALRLQDELTRGVLSSKVPVTLLLGNPSAARQNVRFLEEDFNRVFTFDRPAENGERLRAEEVRPLLDNADFFLDFHQTQTPTASAFWTFPWGGDLGKWARVLGGAPRGLTRATKGAFSPGKCCLDEYVRSRDKMGLTVEVGTKGPDPAQAQMTYDVASRFIRVLSELASGQGTLSAMAEACPAIEWFETRAVVPAQSAKHHLRPGIGNWTLVSAGELLSPPGAPEIRAPESGYILFPKYYSTGDPVPPELFRIGAPLGDPSVVYGDV